MMLPAEGSAESRRSDDLLRTWLDVAGGVAFALCVALVCIAGGNALLEGGSWVAVIAWESVWLVAAVVCSTVMPSGVRHDISVASTLRGLMYDWPELLFAAWIFGLYTAYLGGMEITAGPLGFALAVGFAEEMLFRVMLLGWLVTKLPAPTALAISSVVFGAAHLKELSVVGVLSVLPQTAGGFVLGAAYLRSRNPIGPILAHAFWDLPFFVALGAGVSGGGTERGVPTFGDLVPWLAFTIYGLWLVRHGVPVSGRVDPVGCTCGDCRVHASGGPDWDPRMTANT